MKINKSKGFTLIEVLVSIGILSIIGLAFFSTINTSIKTNKKNEMDIKALHLAESEVENLRVQIKKSKESTLNIVDSNKNKIIIGIENIYTSDEYIVKTKVEKKESLLYEIRVNVEPVKQDFSKKKTEIITLVTKGRGL